ncbi:hypothetical protein F7C95_04915 [Opitutia bacterium ISCC 51]|nr:hypothetical protein F7C95_04915 [Opitutae bacterium ISCC 51]QXD29316.1 hypothetical protein GA003_04895 [Opitutae bacterium ISCC 52]
MSSKIIHWFILPTVLLLSSSCSNQTDSLQPSRPTTPPLFTFAVMGDVPYGLTPEEIEGEKVILREQISRLNENTAIEFVAHVGDIKKGAPPCEPEVYESVAEILKTSTHPVFIIPGDNEWNDCTNPTEAWKLWESNFMRFEENWTHDLDAAHQPERDENFAFIRDGVLFLGINLVNGKVHDWEEWESRIEDDRRWLEIQFKEHSDEAFAAVIFAHANPGSRLNNEFVYKKQAFRPLIEYLDQTTSTDFTKPILFIHGDGHKWIADLPFPNAGNRIGRIQLTQGGLEAPLLVELRNDPTNPFSWIRNQ